MQTQELTQEMAIRHEDGGRVSLSRGELEMVLRHLERFEGLVKELETRDGRRELDEPWAGIWRDLRAFLESEELEGSEVPQQVDGLYCCQLRTRGLASGQRECKQYNAWYVFAWAACVGTAIFSSRDATLQGGSCANMAGCPQAG